MSKIIQKLLGDGASFLHRNLGLGTILALSFTGIVVLMSPIFMPLAKQATIPVSMLYSDATTDPEMAEIKDFSLIGRASPMSEAGSLENDFMGSMIVEKGSSVDSPSVTEVVYGLNGSVAYKVMKGDLISKLAEKFNVPASLIISTNNLKKNGFIRLGQELSIPSNKPVVKNVIAETSLPDVKKYLSMPVKDGLNLGKLRGNSVDIMATCGTPIYASAEGMVEEVVNPPGNDSNGGYIKIKHQFSDVETIYAHTSKNLVEFGDVVGQSDKIAEVGNTGGDIDGPEGCHLSFGVIGAKNPFVK